MAKKDKITIVSIEEVQTVAQLSGFSDPNYFSKQFKRYYGVTPLQYRKDQPALSPQADP